VTNESEFLFAVAPKPEDLAALPLNDLGNAQRLIRTVGGMFNGDGTVDARDCHLLYLRERGWIGFNGRFWDLRGGEQLARRFAHQVATAMIGYYKLIEEACGNKKQALDFARNAGGAGSTSAMLTQAQAYLTVDLEDFDREPYALNCRNGVVRLTRDRDGEPRRVFTPGHNAADRFTRMVEADYDPTAARPLFDGFLERVQPNPEIRAFLQRIAGYCATADTTEQAFFIHQGKGGDGKSTWVNTIRNLFGSYAVTGAIETFLATGVKRGSEASPDMARLSGDTRLVATAEPEGGAKLATGAIKAFTGNGRITARELRQGIFEFEPQCKVHIECNRRPSISDADDGIWRRLKIIPWSVQIPKHERILGFERRFIPERAGILNWVIDGAAHWMVEGLNDPDPVLAAAADYRKGSNPFGEWLSEFVEMDPNGRERASVFYTHYKEWCEKQGHERPMTNTTFGRALGDQQIIRDGKDGNGNVMRKGARLIPDGKYPTPPAEEGVF
jgi:putative DNA primase/helicase